MSNIRIDFPPTIDNTQKIIIGRFIKNELSASMFPESRLSILELAAQSSPTNFSSLLEFLAHCRRMSSSAILLLSNQTDYVQLQKMISHAINV